MNFRTDLALERRQMLGENLSGVKVREIQGEETKTTVIDIVDKDAAQKLGKGIGRYITIEMKSISDDAAASGGRLEALTKSIASLLPKGDGVVLVAGVGNMSMTSDALGPRTSSMIFATRHIGDEMRKAAGFSHKLRPVATVSSGVLGQTGIESGEYIKSICGVVKPSCVITIDALASGSVSRLGNTVQMSDTGISPGSRLGKGKLTHDPVNGFIIEGHYRGKDYRVQRLPGNHNGLHVEYDYCYIKPHDCIDISTDKDSFYCYPTKENVVTKLSFATEEIYKTTGRQKTRQ